MLTFLSYFCTKSPNLAVTDPFEMMFDQRLLSFPAVTQITAATCLAEAQPQAGCICQAAMEELSRGPWFRGHGRRRRHWRCCTWDHHRARDAVVVGMKGQWTQRWSTAGQLALDDFWRVRILLCKAVSLAFLFQQLEH